MANVKKVVLLIVLLCLVSCSSISKKDLSDVYTRGYMKGKEVGYQEGYKAGERDCKKFFMQ